MAVVVVASTRVDGGAVVVVVTTVVVVAVVVGVVFGLTMLATVEAVAVDVVTGSRREAA